MSTAMCNAALEYAKRGWKVFPALIEENKKKSYKSAVHSNGERWGATTDPDEIRHDFAKWHAELIGIPTGPEQGFFVVEADTPKGHDVDGIASLRALEAEHGPLPDTLMAESATGSLHHYFKWPSEGTIRNSTSRIGPGIDVRGQGGMVLGPPSVRSGVGAYRWLNRNTIADAPPWLIALATADDDDGPRTPGEKPETDPELIYLAMTVIPNNDVSHDDFNRTGMAIWRATGGHPRGLEAFAMWAQKSKKCRSKSREGGFIERWKHYFKSPPTVIGAGSILKWANDASPGWDREYYRKLEGSTSNSAATLAFLRANVWANDTQKDANKAKDVKAQGTNVGNLIQSSDEFAGGFTPPDYQIDGLIQRRYIYSLTAPTGAGKTCVAMRIAAHSALGLPLDGRDVEKGRVLFFAGENPDDIRMRWIKLCEEMEKEPSAMDVFFLPGTPTISDAEIRARINAEAMKHGPFGLVIIDTSAAYFQGDDENSNAQLGKHARMLRSFVGLPGDPTVLVTCHPTKSPNMDNLLPRGGGSFIAEMDGNLVLLKKDNSTAVELHWHGKFRGPDFAPIPFKLQPGTTEKLKDRKGRLIWTVTAAPITEAEASIMEDKGRARQDELLLCLQANPGLSLTGMAEKLGWQYRNGLPNKTLVNRTLTGLLGEKLIEKKRGRITITPAGEKAAAKDAKF